jgi:hypothetical protein
MKPNLLYRWIALLLVPCLVAIDVQPVHPVYPVRPGINGHNGPTDVLPFPSQALALHEIAMKQPGDSTDPFLAVASGLKKEMSGASPAVPAKPLNPGWFLPGTDHPEDYDRYLTFLKRAGFTRDADLVARPFFRQLASKLKVSVNYLVLRYYAWVTSEEISEELADLFTRFTAERARQVGKLQPDEMKTYTNAVANWINNRYRVNPRKGAERLAFRLDTGLPEERIILLEVIDSKDEDPGDAHYFRAPDFKIQDGRTIPVFLIQLQARAIQSKQFEKVLSDHEFPETAWRALDYIEPDADLRTRQEVTRVDAQKRAVHGPLPGRFSPGMHHPEPPPAGRRDEPPTPVSGIDPSIRITRWLSDSEIELISRKYIGPGDQEHPGMTDSTIGRGKDAEDIRKLAAYLAATPVERLSSGRHLEGGNVLIIGPSRIGATVQTLQNLFPKLTIVHFTSIDESPFYLASIDRVAQKPGLEVEGAKENALEFPEDDAGRFDAVLDDTVFDPMAFSESQRRQAAKEIARVLKPGGVHLTVATPLDHYAVPDGMERLHVVYDDQIPVESFWIKPKLPAAPPAESETRIGQTARSSQRVIVELGAGDGELAADLSSQYPDALVYIVESEPTKLPGIYSRVGHLSNLMVVGKAFEQWAGPADGRKIDALYILFPNWERHSRAAIARRICELLDPIRGHLFVVTEENIEKRSDDYGPVFQEAGLQVTAQKDIPFDEMASRFPDIVQSQAYRSLLHADRTDRAMNEVIQKFEKLTLIEARPSTSKIATASLAEKAPQEPTRYWNAPANRISADPAAGPGTRKAPLGVEPYSWWGRLLKHFQEAEDEETYLTGALIRSLLPRVKARFVSDVSELRHSCKALLESGYLAADAAAELLAKRIANGADLPLTGLAEFISNWIAPWEETLELLDGIRQDARALGSKATYTPDAATGLSYLLISLQFVAALDRHPQFFRRGLLGLFQQDDYRNTFLQLIIGWWVPSIDDYAIDEILNPTDERAEPTTAYLKARWDLFHMHAEYNRHTPLGALLAVEPPAAPRPLAEVERRAA